MASATPMCPSDLTRDEEFLADLASQEEAAWVALLCTAQVNPAEAQAYDRKVTNGTPA